MKKLVILFVGLCSFKSSSQSLLTLDEAVKLTLQNNFDIQLARNSTDIAAANNTAGNAGMLPTLNATAATGGSNTNINQNLADGRTINRSGVPSNSLSAGATLNWTLFDGMGMFINRTRLKQMQESGEQNYRLQVENSLYQVMTQYFALVKLQYLVKVNQSNLQVSTERLRLAENRYQAGTGSKLDYLQNKVDYNNDRSALLTQEYVLDAAKIQLNVLMARDASTAFTVTDSITSELIPEYGMLQKDLAAKNSTLKLMELNKNLAALDIKSIRAQQLPKLSLNAGYNYNRSKTTAGFMLLNQNQGAVYGVNATVPLFNGFNLNRQYHEAQLLWKGTNLQYQKQQLQLNSELSAVYLRYKRNNELLQLQQENTQVARQTVAIALEKYRTGTSTLLDVKNAQQNLLNTENSYISVLYEVKIAELDLMKLSGNLIKGN